MGPCVTSYEDKKICLSGTSWDFNIYELEDAFQVLIAYYGEGGPYLIIPPTDSDSNYLSGMVHSLFTG